MATNITDPIFHDEAKALAHIGVEVDENRHGGPSVW